MSVNQILKFAVLVMTALPFVACTITDTKAPPLQGPSELALSLTMTANPDTISQDGASQSLIVVQAFDANGQPARDISLRAEIVFGGVAADFGTLGARTLVTAANGRASLTYTAPPMISSVDANTVVMIRLTPSEGDFASAWSRSVSIRLVPPGFISPGGPAPNFTITPADNPPPFTDVLFDGTTSTAAPGTAIVTYTWTFGDGGTASGPKATHQFNPGTYTVTLTVVDSNGISVSRPQLLTVGAGTPPTADFVFSPTAPLVNQDIYFNASLSKPAVGRTIVRYAWNFGDGTSGTGSTPVPKRYGSADTYAVVLTVRDDRGQTGTKQTNVTVGTGNPVVAITFSPSTPASGTAVNFNGSGTTTSGGATITTWAWDFGDLGTSAVGPSTSHTFAAPGTYIVRLTVTDSQGRSGTGTVTVTVT